MSTNPRVPVHTMTQEEQLREKPRKITALFENATTPGERDAAAAIERVNRALTFKMQTERPVEVQFSLPDRWQRRWFAVLCRHYRLQPYRYKRQRYTTLIVKAPRSFVEKTLWPEYLELKQALDEYLNEATQRIIREEVFNDTREVPERAG